MESEKHDRYPTALVYERRTLLIQDATDTAPQELCRRVGDTWNFDGIAHMGVEPPRHRSIIGAHEFQGHMLPNMGTIGQRCLTYHALEIAVRPEVGEDARDHQHQDRRRGHPHREVA